MALRGSKAYEEKRRSLERKRELDRKHEERKRAFIEQKKRNKMSSRESQDPPENRSSRTTDRSENRRIPPGPDAPEPLPGTCGSHCQSIIGDANTVANPVFILFSTRTMIGEGKVPHDLQGTSKSVKTGQLDDKKSQTEEGDRQSQRTKQERSRNAAESRQLSSRDQIGPQPSTSKGYQSVVPKSPTDRDSARKCSPGRNPTPKRPRNPDHGYTPGPSRGHSFDHGRGRGRGESRGRGRGYTGNRYYPRPYEPPAVNTCKKYKTTSSGAIALKVDDTPIALPSPGAAGPTAVTISSASPLSGVTELKAAVSSPAAASPLDHNVNAVAATNSTSGEETDVSVTVVASNPGNTAQ